MSITLLSFFVSCIIIITQYNFNIVLKIVTVCTFKAFAASYHEPIQVEGPTINFDVESEVQAQQYVDFKFKGLKNSQHIILVKGGGYLLNEDGSDVDKSNLQDGDRIITVKQAKEIEKASYLEDED